MRRLPAACLMLSVLLPVCGCSLFEGGALGRKYVVFFDTRSAALDGPAKQVVSQAAGLAADNPALDVLVEGYAGTNGSLSADAALSARRGEVVASALRVDGVAANRIRLRPRGPTDEDPGVAARRVEIDFDN